MSIEPEKSSRFFLVAGVLDTGFQIVTNLRFHVSCISSCFERENRPVLSSKLGVWMEVGQGIASETANHLENGPWYYAKSLIPTCGDRKLQEKYARQIIDAAGRLDLPRMKASGLNQLAVALRKKDDSEGARKALREAISIAQQVGSVNIESMNIANLGNAFHDDKMDAEAETAYLESLTMAREHGLLRQQGHALQVLARLRYDQNRDEEAIEFGKQALSIIHRLARL